jgi:hypothetical protein
MRESVIMPFTTKNGWLFDCHSALLDAGFRLSWPLHRDFTCPVSSFTGKRQFTDTVGLELSGMAAARKHATQQVRELRTAMCAPHVQDLSGWSLSVADAKGASVIELGFDLRTPVAND